MIFKNEEQLKAHLLSKCKNAVSKTEEKVHRVIDATLNKFYDEFEPDEYIRTGQLLHSLVRSGVKPTGSGFEAEVYFDEGMLNYQNGQMYLKHTPEHGRLGYATWDGGRVLDVAMTGGLPHGNYYAGTPIWTTSKAKLGNIMEMLKQELIKQGIPIK